MAINLLDPSLGIQNIMEPQVNDPLPFARPLASSVLNEAGLEGLYAPSNSTRIVEAALCPDVGDGNLLRPEIFAVILKKCAADFASSDDPAVQELVEKELHPLMKNHELLQAYTNLMIGG